MTYDINKLKLKRIGINTYKEAILYLRHDSKVCRSEGFEAPARIQITHKNGSLIATLNTVETSVLRHFEAGLSNYAWETLNAMEGDEIFVSHPKLPQSVEYIRSKIYGHELNSSEIHTIINDLVTGSLSDIQVSAFLAASGNGRLNKTEIKYLTQAMVDIGERISWPDAIVADKHCVGGLPGNRTSLIVVPIVSAFGLTIPKTSSRGITSPAGTADTMEVLAPVELNLKAMRRVVEQENGCIVWGGSVALSPADDILIRIERALVLDSEGQMVASILSKKIAAGSTNVVIDIPVGPTVKVRTLQMAEQLKGYLESIGSELGVEIKAIFSDGLQPVGRGIGPALEARDVINVLQCNDDAPQDLRERGLTLAGTILEFSPNVAKGSGKKLATDILDSGQAWKKFQAICNAQGGLFEPPTARYTIPICAKRAGVITMIDNRQIARVAKLAGAPQSKAAGIDLLTPLGTLVEKDQPLFILHADSPGELEYARNYLERGVEIFQIQEKS